jgi:hypothetical protein
MGLLVVVSLYNRAERRHAHGSQESHLICLEGGRDNVSRDDRGDELSSDKEIVFGSKEPRELFPPRLATANQLANRTPQENSLGCT